MDVKEILEQIEAGLEGVTPGPWGWSEGRPDVFTGWAGKTWTILQVKSTSLGWHEDNISAIREAGRNAAHIARCNPDTMRAILAHIRELEARADNAEKAFVAALKTMSEEARKRGGAEGRLEASEMAGIVDGWKARAEAAEAKVALAKQALEIIAGKRQCIDNLMGNGDVADAALAAMEATDE